MSAVSLHLALNHISPIFAIAALVVLVLGAFWRNEGVVRAAFVLLVISALIGVPTFLSGEEAEHVVEELEGVSHASIESHEDAAKWSVWLTCIAGAMALFALIAFRGARPLPRWALVAVLVLTLMSIAAGVRTSFLGGKIRHPEATMKVQ